MKRKLCVLVLSLVLVFASAGSLQAQCSICTKTTQQLGEKPARGMNSGILYLAFTPLLIVAYIGYRWRKSNMEP
ncbi:MAG: hypothetical protein EOO05_01815 [Chitinophagaceae bacterium]|nr:MAG: hypothetical protein EOO05_01815 [Chitinophagaceae bacterium]